MGVDGSWSIAKILGGVGIAFATAFFALTIRFVSEIRSELATVQTLIKERGREAEREITYLRQAYDEISATVVDNRADIDNLEVKLSKLLDSYIKLLQDGKAPRYPHHTPPDR